MTVAITYDFRFEPRYAGQSATVVDLATGSEVSGSPITLDASGAGSLSLAEGAYQATVSNTALGLGQSRTAGQPNIPESVNGSASIQTAYFIATGSGVTDNEHVPASIIADPDYELPSWVQVVDDELLFPDGGLFVGSSIASVTAAFPTTTPGAPSGYTSYFCDGYLSTANPGTALWGTDYYAEGAVAAELDVTTDPSFSAVSPFSVGASIHFEVNGDAAESDGSTPITDGTYDITCYVQIHRILPAPVLPEA